MNIKAKVESIEVLDGFVNTGVRQIELHKVVIEITISKNLISTYDYQVYENLSLAEMVARSINDGKIKPLCVLPNI